MKSIWIIGAGRFGKKTSVLYKKYHPQNPITLIDINKGKLRGSSCITIQKDGVKWLDDNLDVLRPDDIIIPAAPIHLAGEWIKQRLKTKYHIELLTIPQKLMDGLPHPMPGKNNLIYTSHADFICPDNCPEPESICTHTGKKRPMDLYRILETLNFSPVTSIVIRSRQLFPGTGGYTADALLKAYEKTIANTGHQVLIGTACRCHGVAKLISLRPKE